MQTQRKGDLNPQPPIPAVFHHRRTRDLEIEHYTANMVASSYTAVIGDTSTSNNRPNAFH
ncbi:hypothetical protein C0Q70_02005 [Pomacea canaliculata]|uniref:Uncharacterized protein n=1 Tax=Pomacea canaliculata TaxID=400727 RepID=A0A2T7Q120_POMCA|nr:hypothetical protein C0Q70_02005 [Pomacea canaliculata]